MRYFIEVAYRGTNYSGFQIQKNANTVQAEMEKALFVLLKQKISLTGSSRTDSGVHALQNFFHFDSVTNIELHAANNSGDFRIDNNANKFLYNLNSILPEDIVCKNIIPLAQECHCRFDAVMRKYKYFIYRTKDPFLKDRAYYFPYKMDMEKLGEAATLIKGYTDFTSFSKKNTQVKTFECTIFESDWLFENNTLVYQVGANRFLRGMVRALTATMLKVGRSNLSINEFRNIIEARNFNKAFFAVPAHGLFLESVKYPVGYFEQ